MTYSIKFQFEIDLINNDALDNIFKKIGSLLNIQLDENLKPYTHNIKPDYDIIDVSKLNQEQIESKINSFFSFDFLKTVDVSLYKFLVLKNKDKLIILANIHPLIFDYALMNDIYKLFKETNVERNLIDYYNNAHSYLSPPDFENDAAFWNSYILDAGNYIKFHNIKSDNYNNIKIPFKNEKIGNFLKKNNISKFEFAAAIFSLYLSRINRSEGCILKTNTPHNDYLEKTTLLKIEYLKDNSFIEYLNEIKEAYGLAVEHTKVNIENYVEEDLSYYHIYDFTNFENVYVRNGEGSALTLNLYNDYLDLVYNSDLFSDVFIDHMAKNIESIIYNVLNSPNQKCKTIDILSDKEKELLSDFSKGKTIDVDKNKTLAMSFRDNAEKYPNLIAVDDGINQVTYANLESSSNSVAYDLSYNYNLNFGDRVGLMLPRTYHFLETVLALNKIGVIFVPIDPYYPLKRIEHMLELSEATCIITTKEYAKNISFNVDIIYSEDLNMDYNEPVECLGSGDDLLSIVFTSGTTGLPKGVMISNNQINGEAAAFKDIFKTSVGDVIGYFASFSFIAAARMYASLMFGECCRIFNETEQKDSLLLIKSLKEHEISDLILPPSLGIPIFEKENIKLKYLILAGAKLNELTNKQSATKLVNFYGSTETIMSIVNIFDINENIDENVPVGRAVPNTWAYILDGEGMQLPIGVAGEICVSNDYLSPGYYNDPDLTNEVFVDNPLSTSEDNKRMYRTGDIGFYNFNGEIVVTGREDNQLSVRGFRIESGEVLGIMKKFKEINDIYLDVDKDNLIAYYTTTDDLNIGEVKEALNLELPYYMIPSIFIELDEIPLNANGKIDKFALNDIVHHDDDIDIEIDDDILCAVLDAFKNVLNCDFVYMNDDFVELGGNSLYAMKLQLLLNEKLGVNLYSNEIIELRTPINITNHIKFNLDVHSPVNVNYTFEDICPLSESQLNVYLDETVKNMGTAYNNPFKIEFNKNYSIDEIKIAIEKLFEIHPVLSARVINENERLSLGFDARPQITTGLENKIESFVQPFELDKYLSRFLIIDRNCLCVDFHHLIFDGTSAGIILNSLMSILDGDDIDLVDNGVLRQISFEENIAQKYMENADEFFESMLSDRDEVYELLPSIKTEDNSDFEYNYTFNIDNNELNSFLNSQSITPNQFFCSVFAYTLSRFSGSSKVLFNLIEDGRGHIDLSESVGMFVRTLPLLIDCKNQSISSFLDYSSNLINSVMKYDLYPFRLLANQYDLNSNILFQYSHNLFQTITNEEDAYAVDDLKQDMIGDLSFFIFNAADDKLGIRVLYSEKFSKEFIEHFAESYRLILNEIMDGENLSDINYVTKSDLSILNEINQTESVLKYGDVLEAFNDNLLKHPKNSLVTYNDNVYSYDEGAFIANEISNKLKSIDVEKEDNIAFLVERSELYIFTILGILSAGAVYVPLDDTLPDERLNFMINDVGAKAVIVSDETYNRANDLTDDAVLLNISDILKGDLETLSSLPVPASTLACILYTSGTTGIPKGVKITRKSLVNFIEFYVKKSGIDYQDIFAMYASIGFDVGAIKSILVPAYCGACLDIVPKDVRLDMHKLNNHFNNQNVTHTHLPTQIAKLFINETDNNSLNVLFAGGEKLGEIEHSSDFMLFDSYGPTETCVSVTAIRKADKIDSTSIGYLYDNLKAYILDDEFRRVPCGAVGELFLAGYQIAAGYLNRPEENTKAFISNPFDDKEGYEVLYRSGDMVRLLPDGSIGIVGRRDKQVKIRGNRVELLEVEAIIRKIDYVNDVTIQTIKNGNNNELVAYVVADDEMDNKDLQKRICDYVSSNKPDYMVPSFVIDLDNIPLNVNGKVDRRALPEVDRSSLHVEYVAPRNEKEKTIVEAFEKVFDQKNISIHDDFTRLGGDSLLGIKLMSYLEKYDITMADILNLRTPAAIADNIDDFPFDLDIYSVEGGCPLNENQVNLFADIMINKTDIYHIPAFMNIPKRYSLEKILDTIDEMIRVHPIIGMHISNHYETSDEKNLYRKIRENISLLKELGNNYKDDSIVDLLRANGWNIKNIYVMIRTILKLFNGEYPYLVTGAKPPVKVESNFSKDIVKNFMNESLDLYNYLSMFIIIESNDSYILLAKFHHLIFDGLSVNIFKNDFQILLDGGKIDIDDKFLKTSAFSKQIKNTDKFIEAGDFFDSMLKDLDEVKGLTEDSQSNGFSVSAYDLEFDNEALKLFLKNNEVNESVLFTSVFAYALSRFSSDKVSFALIENGRDRFKDYDSIGLYAGIVPLLINCEDQSIKSFLEHSSNIIYGALKYDFYSILLISKKYPLDVSVIFQYVPDWIAYDGIKKNEKNELLSSEISDNVIDSLLGDKDDLIAKFIVQIFQTDENYTMLIVNSNNYSDGMIKDFVDTFNLILSEIIHKESFSNISSVFE